MKVCERCKIAIKSGTLCQTCRKYEKNGGVWYIPPKFGEMKYDPDGKPICHVCGMACNKLIEHTKRKHGLLSAEYRKEFGLMDSTQLTSPEYHDKMKQYTNEYQTHKGNFVATWNGEKRYVGGRKIGSWSAQEKAYRVIAQQHNGSLSKSNISPPRMKELCDIWKKNLPHKQVKK